MLNDFTERVYPELDLDELFQEYKLKEDIVKAAQKAERDAAIAAAAAAEKKALYVVKDGKTIEKEALEVAD